MIMIIMTITNLADWWSVSHDSPVEMWEVLYLHLRLSGANAPGVPNLRVRRRATPNWQPPRNMGGKKWSKKCIYIYICIKKILYKYPVGDISLSTWAARYLILGKSATCSHLQPLEWPQVTASDRREQVTASARKWPQVPANDRREQVTASDRKWPQVTASDRK